MNQRTCSKDGDFWMCGLPKEYRFSYLKGRVSRCHHRGFFARKPQVRWSAQFCRSYGRLASLFCVTRTNDRKMRQHAHEGNILESLVRGAIWTGKNARMHPAHDNLHVVDRDRRANLLPIPAWAKCSV